MIEESIGPVWSSSSYFETEAWGKTDQDDFINVAIEVEHYMTPNQLLNYRKQNRGRSLGGCGMKNGDRKSN